MLRIKILLLGIFAVSVLVNTQNIDFSTYRSGSDTVINCTHLTPFFTKLSNLEKFDSTQVLNILHIGDSHIQADFLTREIRNSLQKRFGNAGRGLVFPYRLTKSNESYDFRTSSGNSWKWETVRTRRRQFEPGIAGTSLLSTDDVFNVELKINKRDSIDNTFNNLKLICRNDSNGLLAFVTVKNDSTRKLLAFAGETIYETKLDNFTENVALQSNGNLLIDGIVLNNGNKGIQYHVIGINGAHYADYNQSPVFFAEMPMLQPDLIFVSLGTNEGVNSRVSSQTIVGEVDKMVRNIRLQGIDAPIVIITPFDNFYRRKKPNSYLSVVRNGLLEASSKNNISCMDMYGISGGFGSAIEWRNRGLITSDRIHYTAAGYSLQGKMIFNTLINSYSKYAAH